MDDHDILDAITSGNRTAEEMRQYFGPPVPRDQRRAARRYQRAMNKQYGRGTVSRKVIAEVRTQWEGVSADELADPIALLLVKSVAERYNASELMLEVPVRSTWTGHLNAMALRLPSGNNAILFDVAAVYLSRALGVSVMTWLSDFDSKGNARLSELWFRAVLVMANALRFLESRDERYMRHLLTHYMEVVKRTDYDLSAHRFAQSAQEFILAHELGHISLGHVGNAKRFVLFASFAAGDAQSLNPSQRMELAADDFALRGIQGELDSLANVAALMRILSAGDPKGRVRRATHPTWGRRLDHLLRSVHSTDAQASVRSYVTTIDVCIDAARQIMAATDIDLVTPQDVPALRRELRSHLT